MPRMSEAEKQRSHQRILEAAARLFRANGIGDTSVVAAALHSGFGGAPELALLVAGGK